MLLRLADMQFSLLLPVGLFLVPRTSNINVDVCVRGRRPSHQYFYFYNRHGKSGENKEDDRLSGGNTGYASMDMFYTAIGLAGRFWRTVGSDPRGWAARCRGLGGGDARTYARIAWGQMDSYWGPLPSQQPYHGWEMVKNGRSNGAGTVTPRWHGVYGNTVHGPKALHVVVAVVHD